jgi:hypothetical protein
MWLLAAASFVTLIVATIVHTFNYTASSTCRGRGRATEDARTALLAGHG